MGFDNVMSIKQDGFTECIRKGYSKNKFLISFHHSGVDDMKRWSLTEYDISNTLNITQYYTVFYYYTKRS